MASSRTYERKWIVIVLYNVQDKIADSKEAPIVDVGCTVRI
jgi:hypothetical protein